MEDFVTYEQALRLKELDFDWPCYEFWDNSFCPEGTPVKIRKSKSGPKICVMSECNSTLDKMGSSLITAPSLAKAAKWLREEKGLFIFIWLCANGYGWTIEKCGNLNCNGTFVAKHDEKSGMFTTYEAALSAGIDEALKLIKENYGE